MELTDTHTHLYIEAFDADRNEVIKRALENDVNYFFLPNIDNTSIRPMLDLEEKYPERCFAMMGLHPCSVGKDYQEQLAKVREWLDKRPFCAIGEIGMDLYWDKTFVREQETAFLQQAQWAVELDVPIVIHSRETTDLLINLIRDFNDPRLHGIFHCFGGTVEQAEAIIELGFLLGIGGVVTFKKSGLDQTVAKLGLENLVLETDSPYLAPTPFRGKRNESAYIRLIAEKVADIKGVDVAEVAPYHYGQCPKKYSSNRLACSHNNLFSAGKPRNIAGSNTKILNYCFFLQFLWQSHC